MPAVQTSPITPRGIELNLAAARPFEAIRVARDLLRTVRTASLSTLDPGSGYPYGTVTNLAVEPDGTPFFFVARLAVHARNLEVDARAALTLVEPDAADVLTRPRLTLVGRVGAFAREDQEEAKERYLARHPKAKLYLSLPDACLYRLEVEAVQLNGGPAQNANEVTPGDLRTETADAGALMRCEREEVRRLNAAPEEVARLAALAGGPSGRWRVTGIDPEGIDLATATRCVRHWFGERVTTSGGLAAALQAIGADA